MALPCDLVGAPTASRGWQRIPAGGTGSQDTVSATAAPKVSPLTPSLALRSGARLQLLPSKPRTRTEPLAESNPGQPVTAMVEKPPTGTKLVTMSTEDPHRAPSAISTGKEGNKVS